MFVSKDAVFKKVASSDNAATSQQFYLIAIYPLPTNEVLTPFQWRSQPDFLSCYANISTFKEPKNNDFKEINDGNHSKSAIA